MYRSLGLGLSYRVWAIPALYAIGAIIVSIVLPRVERDLFPHLASPVSVSGATAIYSAIASGMIALTGIVFSMAFVMVQFSASTYSPRLAFWLARDPYLAHAFGMFIATFVYAIAALSWIDRAKARVPLFSFWLVLALLLASMGLFITLIQRIGTLQVNRTLTLTGNQGRNAIETLYPLLAETPAAPPTVIPRSHPAQTLIHHGLPRAVQGIHTGRLLELAAAHDAVIEVVASVGDVVVERSTILEVFGTAQKINEQILRNAIDLGEQRIFTQDPKYAIRLLVDVAIRALSPALNDPTTSIQALDEIADLLVHLGLRRIEIGTFYDGGGSLRLIVPFPSWEDYLLLAFDEIRHYGGSSVQVMRRMSALVSDLISVLPEERRPALRHWHERIRDTIARSFAGAEERHLASEEDRQGLGGACRHSARDKVA